MSAAPDFLTCVARALLVPAGAEPAGEPLPLLAGAVWAAWRPGHDAAGCRQELRQLSRLSPDGVTRAVEQALAHVVAAQPTAVRTALASYLSLVPGTVRQALRRRAATTGTAKARVRLAGPDDLVPFLPPNVIRLPDLAAADTWSGHSPAAPPSDGVVLTVLEGPHQGQSFAFVEHDTFLVGRSRHAHFRLAAKDMYFSRVHFMVEANPPHCRLSDMGSRNGTFVNGRRVTVCDLRDGDQVRAGHTLMRVTLPTADEPEPPTLPPPPPPDPLPQTTAPPGTPRHAPPPAPLGMSPECCPVCAAPVTRTLVCPACWESSRDLVQPVEGYLFVRELGRGGMGVVYLAVRAADAAVVAVKTVTPAVAGSGTEVERFLREANVLRMLDHPHIVRYRETGEAHGLLYFATDYVPGRGADRLLKESGPLPVGRAAALACQVLEALEYAHARGFVHRDIKPANVLVAEEGGGDRVWLADFGLARVYQGSKLSGLTMGGQVGGTAEFMPPEQVTHYREARPAGDLYATGATLYNLLTGRHVHDPAPHPHLLFVKILEEEPVPIRDRKPDLPEGLAAVVHTALAKDPAARFADAWAMREALRPYVA